MMKIPINREYKFTVKLLEDDSFNPQDLSGIESASFSVFKADGSADMFTVSSSDTANAIGYWYTNGDVVQTTTTEVETLDGNGVRTDYSKNISSDVGVYSIGIVVGASSVEVVDKKVTTAVVVTDDATSATISSNTDVVVTGGAGVKDQHLVNISTSSDTPSNGQTTTTTVTTDGVLVSTTTTTTTTEGVAANTGILTFVVKAATTGLLGTESLGAKEDGYYLKAEYRGSIVVKIAERPDINVLIDSITAVKV